MIITKQKALPYRKPTDTKMHSQLMKKYHNNLCITFNVSVNNYNPYINVIVYWNIKKKFHQIKHIYSNELQS